MISNAKKSLDSEQVGALIALVAMILGTWLRFYPVFLAGFPINDGGLFYRIVQTIQQNRYAFPSSIQYNGLQIPFAYPPLPFYIAAILNGLFPTHLLSIIQWTPAVVLSLALGAFFLLARSLIGSTFKAAIALMLYAFLPRSITWLIMGGGLTRSFGQLFLILTLIYTYRLFKGPSKGNYAWAIVFGSLVVLSHPEAALHTAVSAIVFWLCMGRGKTAAVNAFLVAIGVTIVTAPWWGTVLSRHGIEPLLSASRTGFLLKDSVFSWLFNVAQEPFVTLIMVLGFIGLLFQVANKQPLLPVWYITIFFVDPRNAPNVATVPVAILASVALTEVILPALSRQGQTPKDGMPLPLRPRSEGVVLTILGAYLLLGMVFHDLQLSTKRLSPANRQAFEWVRANSSPESQFLLITGQIELLFDWTQEWFPVLADRVSLTTVQGKEWLPGHGFLDQVQRLQRVQHCVFSSTPLPCLDQAAGALGQDYNYVYVARTPGDSASAEEPSRGDSLIAGLDRDARFKLVYETEQVVIFRKGTEP